MIDERTRHEMYLGLEEKLGTAVADALMQHLPPIGWADVATKHDLAALNDRLDLRISGLEDRLDLRISALEDRLDLRLAALDHRLDSFEDRLDLRMEAKINGAINRLLLVLIPTIISGLGLSALVAKFF